MNKPNKGQNTWNVHDPDDPYDIKKSMIARLPDHPPQPMGRHLQLVCLLQAAQIERLSNYLTQINSKYRQMERRQLDRHSYEVQIKELAQKNISLNNLQKENQRLKDFIRRQTQELEQLQKRNLQSANFQSMQAKYEGLLNQLRISRTQNENSQKTISRLNLQIVQWRTRWQKSEQQKINIASQFQIQFRQKLNIELKTFRIQAQDRIDKLQLQLRQHKQQIDHKNYEIQSLSQQRQNNLREIRLLQQKAKNKGNIQEAINDKNKEIQRLNIIISEISAKFDQAMTSNQKIGGQLNIIEERYRTLEKQRQKLIFRIKDLQALKIKNQSFEKLQEKVVMMSMEIQRLNGLNAVRARQCADANGQIQRLKFELRNNQSFREQYDQERQKSKRLQNEIEILRAGQNRVKILTDELERVKIVLNTKNEENYILQQKITTLQSSSQEILIITRQKNRLEQQLQSSFAKIENLKNAADLNQTNAYELAKLAKDKSTLQQQLQSTRTQFRNYKTITESQLSSFKSQNLKMRQDLQYFNKNRNQNERYKIQADRLRAQMQKIRGESVSIRRYLQQQKAGTNKLENERNNLLSQNQNMLNQLLYLKKQIENLKIMVKTFEQKERIQQNRQYELINAQRSNTSLSLQLQQLKKQNQKLEITVESIYNEIQRLHNVLSLKVNQNQKLMRDASQAEEKCRFYQSKMTNSANQREYYERELTKLRGELENNTKMANDTSRQLMNRLNQHLIQKQKYQKTILQKDKLINEYGKEKETLQRKLVSIQREIAIKITFQQQIKRQKDQLKNERDRYYQDLRSKQNAIFQLQTTIRQKQTIIRDKETVIREKQNNSRESQGKAKVWESRVTQWQSRLRDAQKGIQIRDEEAQKYRRQNERLNLQIQKFSLDLQQIVKQRDIIVGENNQLKRRIDDNSRNEQNKLIEDQLKNKIKGLQDDLFREKKQSENTRNQYRSIEQNYNRIVRELKTSKQTIQQYQMKIVHIQNTQSRVMQDRLKQCEFKLQQKDNLVISLQRQIKQFELQLNSIVSRDQQSLKNLHIYQQKISLLSVQIQRLNQKLQDKVRQCKEKQQAIKILNTKINRNDYNIEDKLRQVERQFQQSRKTFQRQIQQYKRAINDKNNELIQNNKLIQDLNIRLNQSNTNNSSEEVSRYKIQISNLKIAHQQYQNINMHLTAQRDQLFKISHEYKQKWDECVMRCKEQHSRLKQQLNYRLQQNRRLGQQLGLSRKKQQGLVFKIEQMQRNANREESRILKLKIDELQQKTQKLIGQSQQFIIENENLRQQVNQLMIINGQLQIKINKVQFSQTQINKFNYRINELNLIIQSKNIQISQWDQKYSSLYIAYQQLYHNYQITKSQYQITANNIKEVQIKLHHIGQDYQAIAKALRLKEQENIELKRRLRTDGDLYQKNLYLSKQIDRLTEINKKYHLQVSQLRLNLTENVTLQKRIQEQLALLVVLFAEIESLRARLISTQNQCQQVRRNSLVPCRVDNPRQNRL